MLKTCSFKRSELPGGLPIQIITSLVNTLGMCANNICKSDGYKEVVAISAIDKNIPTYFPAYLSSQQHLVFGKLAHRLRHQRLCGRYLTLLNSLIEANLSKTTLSRGLSISA
jgi:hypothetical protein